MPNGDVNQDALRTGKVNLEQLAQAGIWLLGSAAGVGTGAILTATGAALIITPEPTVSKLAGATTLAAGIGNIADSGYGLYSNAVNIYRALNGSQVYLPSGGFSWAAGAIAPGSQDAQDLGNMASLSLALGSGRVTVGTTVKYGDSAFSQYAPATIGGMLDANAVRPTGALGNILIPTATPGVSMASQSLGYTYYPRWNQLIQPSQGVKK